MKEQMREAFEAWMKKEMPHEPLEIIADSGVYLGGYVQTLWVGYQAGLAVPASLIGDSNEMMQPTDISKQLREYAADSGYSHNDYADTMLAAAFEIERYYVGMLAWKKTAETKDRKLSQEIESRISERCAARLESSQAQQPAQEPVSAYLKNAVATVLEGWTLPDGVRKILETAYFQEPVKQESNVFIDVNFMLPEMNTPVLGLVGKNLYALARVDYDEDAGWLWAIGYGDLIDIRNYEADDDYQPSCWIPMPLPLPPAPEEDKSCN